MCSGAGLCPHPPCSFPPVHPLLCRWSVRHHATTPTHTHGRCMDGQADRLSLPTSRARSAATSSPGRNNRAAWMELCSLVLICDGMRRAGRQTQLSEQYCLLPNIQYNIK